MDEDDLFTMDFLSLGEPFVVPYNSSTNLLSMDYLSLGEPFVLDLSSGPPPTPTTQRARIMTYVWGN